MTRWCASFVSDGVDGKQARRTNSSTPLGELFDHGLDSWACVFFVATVYSIFGRGESGVSVSVLYYILWVVLFSFILSHWEKYNTGILFLPWGYDVSQVVRSRAQIFISGEELGGWRWLNLKCVWGGFHVFSDHLSDLRHHFRGWRRNMVPANPLQLPLQRPFHADDRR